ncbi:MAG: lipase family protein [Verrucomicrobia bacterium]|nr:lipase family protein [Verrucomicrobiota bacterium]
MPNFQLNPNTTRWRAENALSLAMAAQLAYQDAGAIDATLKTWGFDRSSFIESPPEAEWDTQAFVASNAEAVVVAFRGTQPDKLTDWITDADVVLAMTEVGLVHYGFWAALKSVWGQVEQTIQNHQYRQQSLWFTGHSLGAALATLATAKLRLGLKPVHGLYTYGSPRVGSLQFTDRFDGDFGEFTFRYVNNSDVVTRVATREMGYSHVGTSLTFDASGVVHADMHFWNKLLERLKGDLDEFLHGKVRPLNDHASENYVNNTEKNLQRNPF